MSATQPEPESEPSQELRLVLPSRSVRAGAGWDWIVTGWRLFTRAPLMWIISIVAVLLAAIAIGLVPFIGTLAFQLLQGVIAAGFMVACHSLAKGGDFELEHLLAGFKKNFTTLLLVGVFFVVGGLLILMVLFMFVGMTVVTAILTGSAEHIAQSVATSALSMMLGLLVSLALTVPLVAAYWFAPALVVLNDLSAASAMKESFFACMRNFMPFLVYGIVMAVLGILAAIPAGLGFLVWVPVAITSTYAAYRSIFTEEPIEEPSVTV